MRWQVSLQLAVGMGALFGLAYSGVDRFIGPPLAASSVDAADAYAIVGASEIATAWERTRSGRRALVRALAASPTFREGSSDLVEAALESAAVQMGGGSAVLMQAKEKVASFGEGAPDATKLKTASDAQRGVAIVRFERIDGALYAVSAAPVPQSDDRVLVLASKIEETDLRQWIRGLPEDVSVVLLDGNQVIASTVVPQWKKRIAPPFEDEIVLDDARFRTARRTLADDVGTTLEVVGLSAVRSVAGSAVLERVQLLIVSVGGLALLLALVLVLIAPSESVRELIEEFNSASRDLPRVPDTQPLTPVELSHEPALETPPPFFNSAPPPSAPPRGRDWMPDSPPLSPPAPSFSNPALDLATQPVVKRDRPSSDTRLALDAEQKMGRPVPKPPPPVPPAPSRSNPFGMDPIPLPGHGPSRSNATLPPASPFDQIAAAAFAPPSAPPPAASVPRLGPKEDDLLMPKGVDLDSIAREAAKQGPPKYEPTDLPGLRSPYSSSPGLSQVPPPSVSSGGFMSQPPRSQRSEDLPGLRANDPAARAFDRPSSNPQQQRKSSDPWSNPSLGVYSTTPPVQERLSVPDRVPSNPPSKQNTIPPGQSGPIAYDEEHYRVVYNDFVSSKARLGEAVDNITYEGFRSKLRSSEEALINRHGCRAVRFQVLVKDNTVSLRPQLVR